MPTERCPLRLLDFRRDVLVNPQTLAITEIPDNQIVHYESATVAHDVVSLKQGARQAPDEFFFLSLLPPVIQAHF